MTNAMRRNVLPCLMIAVGLGLSQTAYSDGYNPVTQQLQSKLATLVVTPGLWTDRGRLTRTAS